VLWQLIHHQTNPRKFLFFFEFFALESAFWRAVVENEIERAEENPHELVIQPPALEDLPDA